MSGTASHPHLPDLYRCGGRTPAGQIGEQITLAEMLQAVGHSWYMELAPYLLNRADELMGIRSTASPAGSNTA